MTKPNPYLTEIRSRGDLDDLTAGLLATLAIAHELREANALTEAIPDDSGDARIAEAAREFVKLYVAEKSSAVTAMTDLVRVVDEEDRR